MQPAGRKSTCLLPLAALVSLLVVFMAPPAQANTKQWVGTFFNTSWNNPNNWSPTGVPQAGDDVNLTSTTSKTATLNTVTPGLGAVTVEGTGGATFTLKQNSYALSAQEEYIGYMVGKGAYIQNGGSNTVTDSLYLGYASGTRGTYELTAGSLSVDGIEYLGYGGTGNFTQSKGSHTVNNVLYLGYNLGSRGDYTLKGGSLSARVEIIGQDGTGTFTQSEGSNTARNALVLGENIGSRGDYTLKGGSLSVGAETIGVDGTGTFLQSGGTHRSSIGSFILGSLGSGAYTLTGGSLSADYEYIGTFGSATFTQSGGTHSAGNIELASASGSVGTYNLNSGTVSAGGIKINGPLSSDGSGTFNVNGKATVNSDVNNYGKVHTTNAKVTWNGNFVNNNAYTSTTSTQAFIQDLNVAVNGYLVANISSVFSIQGNFVNVSTLNTLWNTDNAQMQFVGPAGTNHDFYIPGVDNGVTPMADNFNWYSLNIAGQMVHLKDGNAASGGAQYVRGLSGAVLTGNVVTNIFGDTVSTLNIYYDPDLPANFYLHGMTYDFANGPGHGQLIPDPPLTPTPLPPSALLLGSGLLGLGLLGWRRKRLKS